MRALLDVNVLIALLDEDHSLHARATTRDEMVRRPCAKRLGVVSDYAKRLYSHHVQPELPEPLVRIGRPGTAKGRERKHLA